MTRCHTLSDCLTFDCWSFETLYLLLFSSGLKTFGIDLKVASKFFGTKFACGASITGDDEIVIQGDCKDDLFDIIPEKWPEVIIL